MIAETETRPVIRRAHRTDARAISRLNADVQALHAAGMPWRFKPPSPETFPPDFVGALIARRNNLFVIAEIGEQPVGYVYAERNRRPETEGTHAYELVYINQIGVKAEFRRRNVGRLLIEAVREAAADVGITRISLDVWSFNADSRAFFVKMGFESCNERMLMG